MYARRLISASILPLVLLAGTAAPIAAQQVVVQAISGTLLYQPGSNFFLGWTFTTPSGLPWNNITVAIDTTPAKGMAPPGGVLALGSAYLFTQPFTGSPADLANSNTAPGFVASSSTQSSSGYVFPAGLVLNPNTQYWVYESGPFPQVSYAGGINANAYIATSPTGSFTSPPPVLNFSVPNYTILGTLDPNAPAITNVANAASNIAAGLPNAAIAQGSIFIVQGSEMGPGSYAIASPPFQSASLDNTSISVTVGGTMVSPLMYYTSAGQLAALLPSNTPAGQGTLSVTYNGNASGSFPVTVVPNNLGIFTIDSSGGGPGIVTYGDYSLVSPVRAANCGGPNTTCGAANPGDTLILWATGLGPVNGNDTSANLGQAMPQIPLTLWLGGVQASVSYQGRSGCCIGEDQIIFTVPDNVPTGCAVPLVVQIGTEISNSTVMPVASGSRNCSLVNVSFSGLTSQALTQDVVSGSAAVGTIKLAHFSDPGGVFEDDAKLGFFDFTGFVPGTQPFLASWVDDQPIGTCISFSNLNGDFSANPVIGGVQLSAGSSFTLKGPQGSVNLQVGSGSLTEFNNTGAFLAPGAYTITSGGGTAVGPVNASITIPAAAAITSPTNGGGGTRANGLTVNWNGGAGNLQIEVNSCTTSSCNNGASAVCNVAASAGTFTVPAYVMDALPAGGSAGVVLSSYSEGSFTATGLEAGTISTYSNVSGFGYGWGSGGFSLQ